MAKVFTSEDEQCQTWLSQTLDTDYTLDSNELEVYFKFNKIEEIHPSIVAMKSLTKLKINDNKIKYIPEELCLMTQLKAIDFAGNSISNDGIPDNLGNLTQLEYLNLSNNKITSIPDTFSTLVSLKILKVDTNDLNTFEFPNSISYLTNLNKLYLQKSRFDNFPFQICNISSLIILNIRCNNISSIPQEISRLISLEHLDLQDNQITDFTPLKPMTLLKTLFISRNNDNNICRNYFNNDDKKNIHLFFE
eukprot:TRINITY_DN567_c0_g6_i1.p1 TRINITY_DN567_c0_g6~~TRINITY_DN567_c0_g6_i1.p1  ORF type:complete len:249 (-),score=31.94 TRINITY_DN567_c0_g6_i1:70-816(-)